MRFLSILIKIDISEVFFIKIQMQLEELPSKDDIKAALERISPYIHRTPIMTCKFIDQKAGATLFFKCENLQKTGAFKCRGAANFMLQMDKSIKKIVAYSTGNHAIGTAYMARQLGLEGSIVMPTGTPDFKINSVKGFGSEVFLAGKNQNDKKELALKLCKEKEATLIPGHADFKIILGAATPAYEVYEDLKDLDYIVVPVGGGGLSSGTIISTLRCSPKTKVIGVQPFLARDAKDSIQKGTLQPQYPHKSLAEGVRLNLLEMTFQILKKHISDIILVQEHELVDAAKMMFERMKVVVELTSAMVLAAILKDERFRGKRVAAVISGGNMDVSQLFKYWHSKVQQ